MVEGAEPNFIATLGLNWKLFLAQLVNFGIVLLILWKWVFKPVAGALEARRQRIESSVKKAEEIETRLVGIAAAETAKLKEARLKADRILKEAGEAGSQARAEAVTSARTEAEKILAEARAAIGAEKESALREVRAAAADMVVAATEKVIKAKLDATKDRELITEALTSPQPLRASEREKG